MRNLFKLIGILFVLSLLALPLTGCDNPPWDTGMVLILKVDTPKDGATVNTSTVTVSGRVKGTESAGATVSINGADVPVKDGKYSTNVTLTEGKNIIKISAKGGQANLEEIRTVNYTK
jgi:nitrogen fixation protein FixH